MEEPDYIIVLHSKYSPQCQKFMEVFQRNPVPYIRPICIDNKQIRQQLYNNADIRVSTVPSIFFVYPTKKMERFEGAQIYDWLIDQVTINQPPPPPQGFTQSLAEPLSEITPIDLIPIEQLEPQQPAIPVAPDRSKIVNDRATEMAAERQELEALFKKQVPSKLPE